MSTCRVCSSLVSPTLSEVWNKPLFESANFVVLPSLGSLVEGWLLLVPKEHVISMGALSVGLETELKTIKCEIAAILQREYGNVCVFEHGPSRPNRSVGCSVDHAHLHLVPIAFDLVEAARPYMPPTVAWSTATAESCRDAFAKGNDYLYVEQTIGTGRIAVHANFGSQILRKAIAARLGVPERFNWREYPEVEVVQRTIRSMSAISEGVVSL